MDTLYPWASTFRSRLWVTRRICSPDLKVGAHGWIKPDLKVGAHGWIKPHLKVGAHGRIKPDLKVGLTGGQKMYLNPSWIKR
jgi:hypothetical protein